MANNDATNKILFVQNLSKSFKSLKAVDDVSFSLFKNEILGLIGPNGAGKTTIIRLIGGVLKPDKGEIYISGFKPEDAVLKGVISFLPDKPSLYGRLTVKDNLNFFLYLYPNSDRGILDFLIERFSLNDLLEKKVENLSKGQTQKVAIARTLALNSQIYVMDEPFNGLDIEARLIFLEILDTLKNQYGKSFLITSHNLSFLEKVSNKILLLQKGKVKFFGTMDMLSHNYVFRICAGKNTGIVLKELENYSDISLIKWEGESILVKGDYLRVLETIRDIEKSLELQLKIIPETGGLEALVMSSLNER